MSITIIAGFAKGLKLQVPSRGVRPTSVMLKRKIFDSNAGRLESFDRFVDLCSGSGAIGLEAISRGAQKLLSVEKNRSPFEILRKNVVHFQESYDLDRHRIALQKKVQFLWQRKFLQMTINVH